MQTFLQFIRRLIPTKEWLGYATLRLGTFIFAYFSTVFAIVMFLTVTGIVMSFGLIFAIAPIAVFLAMRISGAITRDKNPEK